MNDPTAQSTYVDSYVPPVASVATNTAASDSVSPTQSAPVAQSSKASSQNEGIEDQNIFFLLGVNEAEATSEQRESFLDELQQVIWEDFLENDAQLLLARDEMNQLSALIKKTQGKKLDEQEEIVVFLEKLIPDLEEIMLEKALELKADLFKERIVSLREYHAGKSELLATVDQAEEKMKANMWFSAAKLLNNLN